MDQQDLICKFVYLGDKEIGETIDVYEEKLIVKMGAKFAAIPLKNVERVDGDGVYLSAYDEGQALEEGKRWELEKSKPVSVEELKIFGFGDENKNRFSVILREIGELEDDIKHEVGHDIDQPRGDGESSDNLETGADVERGKKEEREEKKDPGEEEDKPDKTADKIIDRL